VNKTYRPTRYRVYAPRVGQWFEVGPDTDTAAALDAAWRHALANNADVVILDGTKIEMGPER
jgi:anion-transporting  ArsA/GET3 family ATPase